MKIRNVTILIMLLSLKYAFGETPHGVVTEAGVEVTVEGLSNFLQHNDKKETLSKVKAHIQQLGAEKYEDRVKAQESLIKIGPSAMSSLKEELNTKDPEVFWRVSYIIKEVNKSMKMYLDLTPRAAAAQLLPEFKNQDTLLIINDTLTNDPDPRVRFCTAVGLKYFPNISTAEMLYKALLKEKEFVVQKRIVRTLGNYKKDLSWQYIKKIMNTYWDADVRFTAVSQTKNYGSDDTEVVEELLNIVKKDSTESVREKASEMLGWFDLNKENLEELSITIFEGDISVVPKLIKTLSAVKSKERYKVYLSVLRTACRESDDFRGQILIDLMPDEIFQNEDCVQLLYLCLVSEGISDNLHSNILGIIKNKMSDENESINNIIVSYINNVAFDSKELKYKFTKDCFNILWKDKIFHDPILQYTKRVDNQTYKWELTKLLAEYEFLQVTPLLVDFIEKPVNINQKKEAAALFEKLWKNKIKEK